MSSFAKMSVYPAGYFRAYARWLLQERRDVASRVSVLNAEVARIGFVKVVYKTETDKDGNTKGTHRRIGFAVSEGSSLAKLVQAYIANGGNPLDISSFMHPDTDTIVGQKPDGALLISEEYPGGGVVAPQSVNYSPTNVLEPGSSGYERHPGGHIANDPRYHPGRGLGGRVHPGIFDVNTIVKTMQKIRGWASQAIKEKLQDIEWRIIKLADLREQLLEEQNVMLTQAFGGALTGLPDPFDDTRFMRSMTVQSLIQDMNALIFNMNDDGSVRAYEANPKTGFTYFVDNTDVSEVRDTLGA